MDTKKLKEGIKLLERKLELMEQINRLQTIPAYPSYPPIFAPGMQSEDSFTPLHKKILCTFYITNKSIAQLGHGNLQYIFTGLYDHHCGTTGYRKISLNNQTDFLIGHTGYLTPSDIRGGTYLFTA